MLTQKDWEGFLLESARSSRGVSCNVSMVGGSKLTLSKSVLDHLGIPMSDIKKVRLMIMINPTKKSFLIRKSPNKDFGHLLSGTPSKPEVYCADKCQSILTVMHKYLSGSGTVRFTDVKNEEIQLDNEKYPIVVVDINSANANAGVLLEMEE